MRRRISAAPQSGAFATAGGIIRNPPVTMFSTRVAGSVKVANGKGDSPAPSRNHLEKTKPQTQQGPRSGGRAASTKLGDSVSRQPRISQLFLTGLHGRTAVPKVRPETIRSSTSVSQVSGSTPFSLAVVRSEARMAQLRAPRSDPAKR
jgi:hypothetical protein